MSDEPLKPRTKGERHAYVEGAADALADVTRIGRVETIRLWKSIFEATLDELERDAEKAT